MESTGVPNIRFLLGHHNTQLTGWTTWETIEQRHGSSSSSSSSSGGAAPLTLSLSSLARCSLICLSRASVSRPMVRSRASRYRAVRATLRARLPSMRSISFSKDSVGACLRAQMMRDTMRCNTMHQIGVVVEASVYCASLHKRMPSNNVARHIAT